MSLHVLLQQLPDVQQTACSVSVYGESWTRYMQLIDSTAGMYRRLGMHHGATLSLRDTTLGVSATIT